MSRIEDIELDDPENAPYWKRVGFAMRALADVGLKPNQMDRKLFRKIERKKIPLREKTPKTLQERQAEFQETVAWVIERLGGKDHLDYFNKRTGAWEQSTNSQHIANVLGDETDLYIGPGHVREAIDAIRSEDAKKK